MQIIDQYALSFTRQYYLERTRVDLEIKHIAHAHGGNVTVESELEKGSTFTLHLPIKQQV